MIPISTFFGWLNYMKYDEMAGLTSAIFSNSDMANEEEVNVYIDLGSMCDKLYNQTVDRSTDPTELSAVVINLAGHIRAYFRSMHSVRATIFFVYSPNDWILLRQMCEGWNDFYRDRRRKFPYLYKYISDSMNIVKMISDYLPGVYFISSEAETSGMILATIHKERESCNNHPNIIFTKEINLLQIPVYDTRSFIYYKNNLKGGSISIPITRDNAFRSYIKFTKRYNPAYDHPEGIVFVDLAKGFVKVSNRVKSIGTMINEFNPDAIDIFIALTNLPSRDLKHLLSWTEALKSINEIQNDIFVINDIVEVYNRVDYRCKIFNKCSLTQFVRRYQCVSVRHLAEMYKEMPEYNLDYRVDLTNSDELKYLNDHYFVKNYIELNKF